MIKLKPDILQRYGAKMKGSGKRWACHTISFDCVCQPSQKISGSPNWPLQWLDIRLDLAKKRNNSPIFYLWYTHTDQNLWKQGKSTLQQKIKCHYINRISFKHLQETYSQLSIHQTYKLCQKLYHIYTYLTPFRLIYGGIAFKTCATSCYLNMVQVEMSINRM
jgi:hypothetical protein